MERYEALMLDEETRFEGRSLLGENILHIRVTFSENPATELLVGTGILEHILEDTWLVFDVKLRKDGEFDSPILCQKGANLQGGVLNKDLVSCVEGRVFCKGTANDLVFILAEKLEGFLCGKQASGE
jgi:hypothetical protein